MKTRILAALLLLALSLTACAFVPIPAPAGVPAAASEAPVQVEPAVDFGTVDGNSYENETLGISCRFPDGWYVYSESDLADKSAEVSQIYDKTALYNAIENGLEVVVFSASRTAGTASATIEAAVYPLSGLTEKEFVERSAPQIKEQFEMFSNIQDVDWSAVEMDFCGQTHTVLLLSLKTNVYQYFEAMLFLPRGDLVYTISVSSVQIADIAEVLNYFEAID